MTNNTIGAVEIDQQLFFITIINFSCKRFTLQKKDLNLECQFVLSKPFPSVDSTHLQRELHFYNSKLTLN